MAITLILMGLVGAYVAAVFVANRFATPPPYATADFGGTQSTTLAGPEISVTTWNIGYAGMGAEADFVMDLGKQRRPTDATLVDRNLQAITATAAAFETDILFFQEAARPSFSTYGRDVFAGLQRALPAYGHMYAPEVATRLIPPPLKSSVGNAIFARTAVTSAERRALPLEPTFEYGAFRKAYKMHILRLSGPERWVMVNVHLSTFDTPQDDVRRTQVQALMQFAEKEYKSGARVIIGGDWNLRLSPTEFPNTTEEKFKFWIRDFDAALKPNGWTWAVDPKVPTVRTAHKPYVAGENYALIVDGFLVSPNVAVESVSATNLGFQNTDHHPVTARFRARP